MRWSREFGLIDRGGDDGRALLACEDEPYSLELVAGEPGHHHTAFELAPGCAARRCRPARSTRPAVEYVVARREPPPRRSGRLPDRARARPASASRWVAHARRSTSVRPGAPRRLGHVNCLSAQPRARARASTPRCSACGSATGSGSEGVWFHVSSDHHVMALIGKGASRFHHLAFDTVDIGQMRDTARPGRTARALARMGPGPARGRRQHRELRADRRGGVLRRALLRHGAASGGPRAARLARRPLLVEHVGAAPAAVLLQVRPGRGRMGAREPRARSAARSRPRRHDEPPRQPSRP